MNTETQSIKRERIISLDLIRGFFLIAIIVDHVVFAPSLFFLLTGGGKLFASPAEGFFVISGILVGYLYGHKILTQTGKVCRKIWKRAGLLYVLSVGLTCLFLLWAVLLPAAKVPLPVWNGDIMKLIINTLTLRYSYGWTDFLSRYAIFMAAAPLLLWLLAKKKWWLVGGGSVIVWALFRGNVYLMPFSAWQLLFTAGLIIGYYLPSIETWFKQRTLMKKRVLVYPILTTAVLTYTASVTVFILPLFFGVATYIAPTTMASYFDKNTLGVGRLLLGTVWFVALYIITRRFEVQIAQKTRGILQIFGENSLMTYCWHGVVLFSIATVLYPIPTPNLFMNTAATLIVLGVMYVLVMNITYFKRLINQLLLRRIHLKMQQYLSTNES